MPLPGGLSTFALTFGDYNKADGSEHSFAGMKGILSVSPPIVATSSGSVLIEQVEFYIGNDGTASIPSLVPNDDPGINQGTAYTVTFQALSSKPAPPNKTFVVRVVDGPSVDYDKLTAVTGTVAVPPPGVNSVNGKTGAVTLTASDVGAAPAGSAGAVASVNSKTGVVVLSASDVGADASGAASSAQAASLQKASNLSDVASAAAARTNLGLGSAATQPTTAFDAAGAAAAAQTAAQSYAAGAAAGLALVFGA